MTRRTKLAVPRGGFAATLLLIAVMAAISILTVVCVKTLADSHRRQQNSMLETQLAWMIVAGEQWLDAGGTVIAGETALIKLPMDGQHTEYQLELSRDGEQIRGVATIKRAGKRVGVRRFFLQPKLA